MQYLPRLRDRGLQCDLSPLFSDEYVRGLYDGRPRWRSVVSGYFARLRTLLRTRGYDLLWIEKELFPFIPAWAEEILAALDTPFVVDYDDALFHLYDQHPSRFVRVVLGKKIDAVMKRARLVTAGNRYLADRAKLAGAEWVEIIPSVVDCDRYTLKKKENDRVTIGWIGSPSTSHYLQPLSDVLGEIQRSHGVRIRLIGSGPIRLRGADVEISRWTEAEEPGLLSSLDIGMMPLVDSPWERGKCGYKLIQYMACGLPVVASPIGVNEELVDSGSNGFLAASREEWKNALIALIEQPQLRKEMGLRGRIKVKKSYTVDVQGPRLASLLQIAAKI